VVGPPALPSSWTRLSPDFCRRDAREVAPELLGWIFCADSGSPEGRSGLPRGRSGLPRGRSGLPRGRIVEVEAYVQDGDAASHSHNGPTPRNGVMFGEPGRLYVYFTYGMHWCANVVCGEQGSGEAVLIRAVRPLAGLQSIRERRPRARRDRDLTNGPAKFCQAFEVDGDANGSDLCGTGPFSLWSDGARPERIDVSPRIGISRAVELPWRWFDPDDENVSR